MLNKRDKEFLAGTTSNSIILDELLKDEDYREERYGDIMIKTNENIPKQMVYKLFRWNPNGIGVLLNKKNCDPEEFLRCWGHYVKNKSRRALRASKIFLETLLNRKWAIPEELLEDIILGYIFENRYPSEGQSKLLKNINFSTLRSVYKNLPTTIQFESWRQEIYKLLPREEQALVDIKVGE
ncbi:MAG: hypothetical protein AMQ74_01825 [Candidatus Methanofastidiosum methylothiophilum]|uniref:Uncharacterized protein n=1 Tax=Candidatus Methanofastidiosum methylothiophilum TaxID=1705564 RepID=A0A150IN32_9EURY|nr:MAG: hypothetical protein AMQ74_01825 [Candidatus Methanofastidiosum methylthiophilus]